MNLEEGLLDAGKLAEKLGLSSKKCAWEYARRTEGFPLAISLGPRRMRWKECEIDEWIAERIAQAEREREKLIADREALRQGLRVSVRRTRR